MNSKFLTATLLGTAAMAMSACSTSRVSSDAKKDNAHQETKAYVDVDNLTLSDAQRDMVTRNNEFGLRLFKKVAGMDSRVVSPLSVTYLMGMLANGAEGQTRQEILSTLGWDKGAEGKDALEEANELACTMMQSLTRKDQAISVDVSNYVAVNHQLKLKDSFRRTVTDYYQAGVEALDFASPKTVGHINGWCSERTHGMIPSIIDQTSPQDVSYLINAIYFNGTWADKFDKQDTHIEPFRGYTRDIKRVPMMHRNGEYFYASGNDFDAVQIPYGDRSFQMTVILPHEGKAAHEVFANMTAEQLTQLRHNMSKCIVDLKLPRFTTEVEQPLNEVISSLGAPTIFTPSANFEALASGQFFVSKMLQKAKIEVSEEGTKAAAVTAAIMTMSARIDEEPRRVNFHADHPFIYLITEARTGAILFIGQYTGE